MRPPVFWGRGSGCPGPRPTLNKKYNLDHLKAFDCNLEQTPGGIDSKFKEHVVKFGYPDFTTYFGLKNEVSSVMLVASISPDCDRISFVQSISKFVGG